MKKIVLGSLALLCAISLTAQSSKNFTIKGRLDNIANGQLVFYYRDPIGGEKIISDSTACKDGAFEFEGTIATNDVIIIVMREGSNGNKMPSAPGKMFVQNGDVITVSGDATMMQFATVSGNKFNDEFNQLKSLIEDDMMYLNQTGMAMAAGMVKDPEATQEKLKQQYEAMLEKEKGFVKAHPDYMASAMTLYLDLGMIPDAEQAAMYQNFTPAVKQGQYGRLLADRFAVMKKTAVGTTAVAFTKKDINGKSINLNDYKGKYVLLDFWGSWCGPCRASHPHLKGLYEKYKGKGLVIIGIGNEYGEINKARVAWQNAIKEDGLLWIQILNNEGVEKTDVTKLYDVSAFPTKILLDKNGKVMGRYTGAPNNANEKDPLEEKLKEVMGG